MMCVCVILGVDSVNQFHSEGVFIFYSSDQLPVPGSERHPNSNPQLKQQLPYFTIRIVLGRW